MEEQWNADSYQKKLGEVIHIGDQIKVMVVRISDNAVRLGIEAPKGMNIAREELVIDGLSPEEIEQLAADPPTYKIQENEDGIAELGRRT